MSPEEISEHRGQVNSFQVSTDTQNIHIKQEKQKVAARSRQTKSDKNTYHVFMVGLTKNKEMQGTMMNIHSIDGKGVRDTRGE